MCWPPHLPHKRIWRAKLGTPRPTQRKGRIDGFELQHNFRSSSNDDRSHRRNYRKCCNVKCAEKRWILHVVHSLKWCKRSSSITLSQKSSASFISNSPASSSSSKHGICSICAWVSFWNSSWAFSLSSAFLAGSEKRGGRQQDAYNLHRSEVVLRPSLDKVRAGRTERRTWSPGSVVIAWRKATSAPSTGSPEHTTTIIHQKPEILGSSIKPKTPTKNRINGMVTKLGKITFLGPRSVRNSRSDFAPAIPATTSLANRLWGKLYTNIKGIKGLRLHAQCYTWMADDLETLKCLATKMFKVNISGNRTCTSDSFQYAPSSASHGHCWAECWKHVQPYFTPTPA